MSHPGGEANARDQLRAGAHGRSARQRRNTTACNARPPHVAPGPCARKYHTCARKRRRGRPTVTLTAPVLPLHTAWLRSEPRTRVIHEHRAKEKGVAVSAAPLPPAKPVSCRRLETTGPKARRQESSSASSLSPSPLRTCAVRSARRWASFFCSAPTSSGRSSST